LYQQTALLWLGGAAGSVGGYSITGVNACALKITEAREPLNNVAIGEMRSFVTSVGDDAAALFQVMPHTGQYSNIVFVEPLSSPTEVVVKLYDQDVFYTPPEAVATGGVRYTYIFRDRLNTYTRDVVAELSEYSGVVEQYNVLHSDTVAFLSQGGLVAVFEGKEGNGYSSYRITSTDVDADNNLIPLDLDLSFEVLPLGISSRQRMLSVRIQNKVPVVKLELVQDKNRVLKMYDI
jgi:hypothetical protein